MSELIGRSPEVLLGPHLPKSAVFYHDGKSISFPQPNPGVPHTRRTHFIEGSGINTGTLILRRRQARVYRRG